MTALNDKEFEREKRRIKRSFRRLKPRLWAGWWCWHLRYERHPDDNEQKAAASVLADWRYRDATITFYMPTVAEMDNQDLDELIIHEVLHAWVNPMRPREPKTHEVDLEESVVTNLTAMHVANYEIGIKEGRRLARKEQSKNKRPSRK